jgi:hypothetical protein
LDYLAYSEFAFATDIANTEPNLNNEICLPEIKFNFDWHQRYKSSLLSFASIAVLLTILGQIPQALAAYRGPGTYYVSTNYNCLNVRPTPSTAYYPINCYPRGTRIRVVGQSYGFARLARGGYVSSRWITRVGYGTSRRYWRHYGRRYHRSYSHRRNNRNYNRYYEQSYNQGYSRGNILRRGYRSSAVADVQRALGITADGYYGATTEAAVRRFQARNGLRVDGVVGTSTRNALGI